MQLLIVYASKKRQLITTVEINTSDELPVVLVNSLFISVSDSISPDETLV